MIKKQLCIIRIVYIGTLCTCILLCYQLGREFQCEFIQTNLNKYFIRCKPYIQYNIFLNRISPLISILAILFNELHSHDINVYNVLRRRVRKKKKKNKKQSIKIVIYFIKTSKLISSEPKMSAIFFHVINICNIHTTIQLCFFFTIGVTSKVLP